MPQKYFLSNRMVSFGLMLFLTFQTELTKKAWEIQHGRNQLSRESNATKQQTLSVPQLAYLRECQTYVLLFLNQIHYNRNAVN
jgi:hypothetical protein